MSNGDIVIAKLTDTTFTSLTMNDLTKPYLLIFETRPQYLYARVTSETISPEMVVEYLHEVTDKCRKLAHKRLLVERDIPTTLSESDIFFTGNEFSNMGIDGMQIAFVDERAANTDHLEFAMLVANNRGGHVELFHNVPDAENWLVPS